MRRGPDPGKVLPLEVQEVRVGRGSKNEIIIQDNEVSRNHLRLIRTPEGYELYDLDSSNGTFVNGQKVEGVWLLGSQCIVELGDSITLEYRLGHPSEDPEVADKFKSKQPIPVTSNAYMVVKLSESDDVSVYPIEAMTLSVGRSTTNDIVIIEPEMSREHFRLTLMPDGYYVEDIGSTNGTFLNGEEVVEPSKLFMHDKIQVGTTIHIELTNNPEIAASRTQTDILGEPVDSTESSRTRRTTQEEISRIIQQNSAEPTEAGTGLAHTSLEDEVLITYAREDWERLVAPMVAHLLEEDVKAWVDQYLIESSNDWMLATEQARLECWGLVVIVSKAAMESEHVRKNWRHFQNREKPIILLMYEPVERLPIGARKLTRIQYNPAVPDVAFTQLANEIKRLKG